MNPWTFLVLGILVGWLFGWLLELWFFRRRRLQCQRNNSHLEAQLRARNAELGAANSQISALRGELGTRAKEIDVLLYQLAKQEEEISSKPSIDEPEPLSGDQGMALAAEINEESATETGSDTDIETLGTEKQPQNPTNGAEITPEQWAILRAAGITTEAELADVNPDDLERLFLAPEWQHADDEPREFDAQQIETTQADGPDDMTLIAGIGPKYAALLQEHDINTFARLGAIEPAALAKIFESAGGRTPNFPSWIEQAQAFQTGE